MKSRLRKANNYTRYLAAPESNGLFLDQLDLVLCVLFTASVVKRYPLKAVRTLKKRDREKKKKKTIPIRENLL